MNKKQKDKGDIIIEYCYRKAVAMELFRFIATAFYFIRNYRRILPQLNIQKIQDYALAALKSNKVLETPQMEVL